MKNIGYSLLFSSPRISRNCALRGIRLPRLKNEADKQAWERYPKTLQENLAGGASTPGEAEADPSGMELTRGELQDVFLYPQKRIAL